MAWQLINFDAGGKDDMSEDEQDNTRWDEEADYSEPMGSKVCIECGYGTIGEQCGFCGNDLCPSCYEGGGGFCSKKHTQQEIDDYEDAMTGGPDAETLRRRKARDELKALGIL